MEDMHNTFNRPLWVTEWACQDYNGGPQCSAAQVQSFLSATQGFMDTTPWIERYSWCADPHSPRLTRALTKG
jgi:hypothetical protein